MPILPEPLDCGPQISSLWPKRAWQTNRLVTTAFEDKGFIKFRTQNKFSSLFRLEQRYKNDSQIFHSGALWVDKVVALLDTFLYELCHWDCENRIMCALNVVLCHIPAVYLWGSGWMWSRILSSSLTYTRAASLMPVCPWWLRPSWTPAPLQNTALGRTRPPTSCFMPRTFPATRVGWRGEESQNVYLWCVVCVLDLEQPRKQFIEKKISNFLFNGYFEVWPARKVFVLESNLFKRMKLF